MEVSILQHAKDTSPKAVGISEIEYWFSGNETSAIDARNSRFKVANLGRQLAQRTAQPHEAVKQDPEVPDHF